ncbi:hypothetical protein [Micromonospora sp. NPDC049497]|uniref:hypothetical protein n=1 Tax=Micromonospora sp. NPDC049497 TaxID=3364273 RepID=UPI0037B44275
MGHPNSPARRPQTGPALGADRAIEAATNPNVRFTNMVTVSLGGVGAINRVVNNTGGAANAANQVVYLTNHP